MRGIEVAVVAVLLPALGCGGLWGIPDSITLDGGTKDVGHVPHEGGVGDSRSGDSGEGELPGSAAVGVSSGPNYQNWCAVTVDGEVKCWGDGSLGMLGDGKGMLPDGGWEWSRTPVTVVGLPRADPAKQVSVGTNSVCALTKAGAVWCWGYFGDGWPGNQSSTPTPIHTIAVLVSGLEEGVTSLSVGSAAACAVKEGSVWCWGWGASGLLGQPEILGAPPPDALVPTTVKNLPAATSVSVGNDAPGSPACAVLRDGRVMCWGGVGSFVLSGVLGNGSDGGGSWTPVPVNMDLKNVTAVSAGTFLTCALTGDGDVWCWGSQGQRYGSLLYSSVPVRVPRLPKVTALSADAYANVCALTADRRVFCWGDGQDGAVGNTSTLREGLQPVPSPDQSMSPLEVQLSGRATNISTGNAPCAVMETGRIECWGLTGELAVTPVLVTGRVSHEPAFEIAVSVSIGGWDDSSTFACARGSGLVSTSAGRTQEPSMCWGANGWGQLGFGEPDLASKPGDLGPTSMSPSPEMTASGIPLSQVSAATFGDFTCGISDAKVVCWGENGHGQLGDGTTRSRVESMPVLNLPSISALSVSAGSASACAVMMDFSLYCWGYNVNGQVGDHSFQETHKPVQVMGGVTSVSVGQSHACALLQDGTVDCWGWNSVGQLGNGSMGEDFNVPTPVKGLTGAVAISAGRVTTCAVTTAGAVECWGDDVQGQLGLGGADSTNNTHSPVPVLSLIPAAATKVAVGDFNACAIVYGGAVCWGSWITGKGLLQTDVLAAIPFPIERLGYHVTDIAVGPSSACAVQDGKVWCWGYNTVGQLGNGGRPDDFVPRPVVGFP